LQEKERKQRFARGQKPCYVEKGNILRDKSIYIVEGKNREKRK